MNRKIILVVGLTLSTLFVAAQEKDTGPGATAARATELNVSSAANLQWKDGPASLPAGAQFVVLDGDPTKPGLFTLRLKVPAGYKIPPHTHPTAERLTVISGIVGLGTGGKFDEHTGRELKAGDFALTPAGVPHFAWVVSDAVVQIHSEGPLQRNLVDSADASG